MELRHKIFAGGAAGIVALLLVIFVVVPFVVHLAALIAVAAIAFIGGEVHGRVSARKTPDELPPGGRALPGDLTR